MASNYQKLGQRHGTDSQHQSCLILDIQPSTLGDNPFLLLGHPACGAWLQQPLQTYTAGDTAAGESLVSPIPSSTPPSPTPGLRPSMGGWPGSTGGYAQGK